MGNALLSLPAEIRVLSDVHCPLFLRIDEFPLFLHIDDFDEGSSGCKEIIKGNASEGVHKKVIWENDSRAASAENIDLSEVGELCAFMEQHNNDIDANILVDKCNKILYNAAEKSGNVITIVDRNNSDRINSKP